MNLANAVKNRHSRLERFAKNHVTGKEGGQDFGNFMAIEAILDNAKTDLELTGLGYYDSNK